MAAIELKIKHKREGTTQPIQQPLFCSHSLARGNPSPFILVFDAKLKKESDIPSTPKGASTEMNDIIVSEVVNIFYRFIGLYV